MFDKAPQILYTLLIEGATSKADNMLPITRGAAIFSSLLEQLPIDVSCRQGFPGVFGAENLNESQLASWQKRLEQCTKQPDPFGDDLTGFQPFAEAGCKIYEGGRGHMTIDFAPILQNGLKSIYEKIPLTSEFNQAIASSLLAVKDFALRFGRSVPWEPATSFDEALDSIWLMYECAILSEHFGYSYSWGQMDQYLLPFAEKLSQKELTQKFIRFFRFLDGINIKDDATALNVGGPEGFNKVSRAIIDAIAEAKLPGPLLTARITENTPDEDFEYLLKPDLLTCGQPTFYGEEACRAALRNRHVEEQDIDKWVVNSCMGLYIPGKEWQDMWGAVLLMPVALEMALNQGRPLNPKAILEPDISPKKLEDYTDFASLYEQTMSYAKYLIAAMIRFQRENRFLKTRCIQNPFVSALYEDCIQRQKEVRDGGAYYQNIVIETMGTANLADELLAIKKLVFEVHRYSLAEIVEALREDFQSMPDLLADIKAIPKYGQNDDESNNMMKRLTQDIADITTAFDEPGVTYAPSLHTLNNHVYIASHLGSTADGRRAFTPIAKNAGTSPDVKTPHTSLILSASNWDQSRFTGGQPIDLWIATSEWSTHEGRQKYLALFRTYFQRGGLQIQVNGANPAELEAAMAHPEAHQNLIVRIGGFSMRFVTLPKKQQLDFIKRFSAGM